MHRPSRRMSGFTLIELMVAVAIGGIIIALAAPSFQDMIWMQRLRGVNAQLVTDLQFARSEAVTRQRNVVFTVRSDANQTCYSIYSVARPRLQACNCLLGANAACPAGNPNYSEIKTVSVLKSTNIQLAMLKPTNSVGTVGIDYTTGGLITSPTAPMPVSPPEQLDLAKIEVRIDDDRRFITAVEYSGRPRVCAYNPTRMQVAACPPAPW